MQQANKHTPLTLAIEHYQRLSNISSIDLTNNDISDLVEKYLIFDDYRLEFNNTPTMQIENMKYDETNKLTSIDSLVIISEDIPKSTYFNTWDENELPKSQSQNMLINIIMLLFLKPGNLDLLRARFLDLNFQDQDLANMIQKEKNTPKISNDASILLMSLMQKKLKDPCWVLILS
ncbi:11309_t:CDS:2 [Cetraspora pellucida]|uniref:11309_t:CDS:1 n=1 Tax=Cetraspora pellucida TaxID=1433469 RepID=A0ACA9M0M7_9GLOM|nr:11309_t:CDS:2 [Cetraspora pellucida]